MASPRVILPGSEATLSRYLHEIGKFPMLGREEEYLLTKRWREHQDPEAVHKLATSHLRLVAKLAVGYRGYGLPLSDLMSEGSVGMLQAINRFDPERGFRLATYATFWIKEAIHQYILRSRSLVKMGTTASQKKLFFNLRRLKVQLQAIDEGSLSPEHVKMIADELDVAKVDVISMNERLSALDPSLNAPQRADSDGEWQERIADERDSQEAQLGDQQELGMRRTLLLHALMHLQDREKNVLIERRLKENPSTLKELSQKYGVSPERVRQIELRAFEKLQRTINAATVERRVVTNRSGGAMSLASERAYRQLSTSCAA